MIKFLEREQQLPISLDEAWKFFSSPENLNTITPPEMNFRTISPHTGEMYEGMIIAYKLTPMVNIPITWVTEITHVKDRCFFVDEQRKGPYRIWHHEHHFKENGKGVLMTDRLAYDIGKGFLGNLAGALFVHGKVNAIFEYRKQKLDILFAPTP